MKINKFLLHKKFAKKLFDGVATEYKWVSCSAAKGAIYVTLLT